jgi:hypothetical protein
VFGVVSSAVLAEGASDPVAQLRACSQLEREERLKCLDKLSDAIAAPAQPAPGDDNWIVSETTSPVDYRPIVAATTPSRIGANGSSMQLAIHCRGGRTELMVRGSAVSRSEDYAISWRINDGRPQLIAAAAPSSGAGAAFTGDVVGLLQSLPENGALSVRLIGRTGVAQDGHFLLGGLKTVREKVATACKWPHAVARPRN